MTKFDFHTHILPKTWPDLKEKFGYSGWIYMRHNDNGKSFMMNDDGTTFRPVNPNVWSISERLNDMKKTGVSVQILSTVPVMFSYWAKPADAAVLCNILNDHLASEIKNYPNNFIGLATLPMQSPELAVEEMKRCKLDLNLHGVTIGSHINDCNLNDKRFDMIWKASEDLKMPIFVHPWDMELKGRMSKYWLPWLVGMPSETATAILSMIFGGVFERFQNLKVCFAHGGGMFPFIFGRAEHCFNVYPKDMQTDNSFPPSKYLGKNIFADTLVHNEYSLNLTMEIFGEDFLFLGSDYPFLLGEHHPGLLIENHSQLNNSIKKKFLYQNVCKFFDIDYNKYINNSI